MAGIDRLDRVDVTRLVELAGTYWEDKPPMFWFGPRQIKKTPGACPEGPVVDLATLLQIFRKMDLPRGCVSFWRYKAAPAN